MECTSYGGNSGSPVFHYREMRGEKDDVAARVILVGVIQGHFLEVSPIGIAETALKIPIARLNSGISAVVPGFKLYEILFSEELKE